MCTYNTALAHMPCIHQLCVQRGMCIANMHIVTHSNWGMWICLCSFVCITPTPSTHTHTHTHTHTRTHTHKTYIYFSHKPSNWFINLMFCEVWTQMGPHCSWLNTDTHFVTHKRTYSWVWTVWIVVRLASSVSRTCKNKSEGEYGQREIQKEKRCFHCNVLIREQRHRFLHQWVLIQQWIHNNLITAKGFAFKQSPYCEVCN